MICENIKEWTHNLKISHQAQDGKVFDITWCLKIVQAN